MGNWFGGEKVVAVEMDLEWEAWLDRESKACRLVGIMWLHGIWMNEDKKKEIADLKGVVADYWESDTYPNDVVHLGEISNIVAKVINLSI